MAHRGCDLGIKGRGLEIKGRDQKAYLLVIVPLPLSPWHTGVCDLEKKRRDLEIKR